MACQTLVLAALLVAKAFETQLECSCSHPTDMPPVCCGSAHACVLCALQVEPRELVVPAGGEAAVLVRVLLDDAAPFKDTLHVLVSEGADVSVSLEATGVGNTVVSEVLSADTLDFGPQFVGRAWQREVEVTNMGRKAVTLTWTNRRLAETLNKVAKAAGEPLLLVLGSPFTA